MLRVAAASLLLAAAGAVAAGCGSSSSAEGPTPAPAQGKLSPREVCTRLVSCATSAGSTPAANFDVIGLYGPNGSCWKDESEEKCGQGCAETMRLIDPGFRRPACNYCASNDVCPFVNPNGVGRRQVCDGAKAACVECIEASQCAGERAPAPVCESNVCHACKTDADCQSLATSPSQTLRCALVPKSSQDQPSRRGCIVVQS
mgnify:CR=1 FL=1